MKKLLTKETVNMMKLFFLHSTKCIMRLFLYLLLAFLVLFILIVTFVIVRIPGLIPAIYYEQIGYCKSREAFLTDAQRIEVLVESINEKSSIQFVPIDGNPNGDAIRIPYESVAEFLDKNKGCCRIVAGTAYITYLARYKDDKGKTYSNMHDEFYDIDACGYVER